MKRRFGKWFLTDDFQSARLAFLPAALEIQHTPPHPLARWSAFSMILFLVLAVSWAIFGKVDVVAVAEGKIIPSSRIQQIQPLEKGVVKALHVREGQHVKAGEMLVELDRTSTGAERSRVDNELQKLEESLARDRALLILLDGNEATQPKTALNNLMLNDLQNQLVEQQWQQYQAQRASLQSQHENRKAEKRVNQEVIRKLQATLPINTKRANDMKRLAEQKLVARDQYLSQEETRIAQQQDLAAAVARDAQLSAAILETEQDMAVLVAQTRAKTLAAIADEEREVESLRKQLTKASDIDDKQVLYAPVDGQVKDLAVNTVGGVVLEAQQIMVIVPEAAPLEVEAWLQNKDIGFVRQNDAAVIKINTFPFTKYGTLDATVTRISEDAIQDEKTAREKGGLLYGMSLLMARNTIWVDGKEEKLMPGMQVSAEIIIGERRVIEYFLAPLQQHIQESIRER